MGQFAKLNTVFESTNDVLLDEDFDHLSTQEEWSRATSNILEFNHLNTNLAGKHYEF